MQCCKNCGANYSVFGSISTSKKGKNIGQKNYYCTKCQCKKRPVEVDDDVSEQISRTRKQNQRLMDTNRIERKAFRERARAENAFEEYCKGLRDGLDVLSRTMVPFDPIGARIVQKVGSKNAGFMHLTDWHLNELVNLPHNKYDIEVASHRLKTYSDVAARLFIANGIDNVVLMFTGDLLNSDRRQDELLNQATNRSKAALIAAELVAKFIHEQSIRYKNISVVSVCGNEGRVDKEYHFSTDVASNNYDFTIMAIAKRILRQVPNIKWGPIDKTEMVIDINGTKVLLCHDIPKFSESQKDTQATIGRYYINGDPIDCMFTGHVHATKITLYSYRGASLVGSNEYNEFALGLAGRAAQNVGFFGEDGSRNVMQVDLQNYGEKSYNIASELMEYNAKSSRKSDDKTVVFQIVC